MNEELKIVISAQTDKAQKNIKDASKAVEKLGEEGKESSGKFKSAMTTMGNAAKTAGKAIGTAMKAIGTAVLAAGTAMVALGESTKEYRTEQAKLQTAFEAAGASAEDATETYNGLYRVLGDSGQATEAAAHIAQLTQNEKEMAEWTNICQGVYATFGDSLPIEGLTEAANETAKVGTVTGSLADALNWAGVSEEEFNKKLEACNTEAEREKLIRETLNGVYDEASQKYEENAASILDANEAQAKLTAGLAALGKAVEPVVTIFKSFLGDVLEKLTPYFEIVSQGLQDMINGVDGGAEKMSEGISGILNTIIQTATDILPSLITIGTEIILNLIDGITEALPGVVDTVVSAIPMIIEGLGQALPKLIEGVAGVIGQLANALPTITQSLVDALPGIIEAIMLGLIDLIPKVIEGIVSAAVIIAKNFKKVIQPIIDYLPELIITIVKAIMDNLPALIEGIISLVLGIVEAIPEIIQGLVDALPTIISSIVEGLLNCLPQIIMGLIQVVWGIVKSLPQILGSLIEGIINIFVGIWDGLENVFANLGNWFREKFGDAFNGIKQAFASIGEFFSGIWSKITGIFANIGGWFRDKFTAAWQAIKNVFSGVGNFFGNMWNTIKEKFSSIGQKIGDAISAPFKKAINWILDKAVGLINGFIKGINWAIGVINKIPGVNISQISLLNVPQFAQGGVVDSATLGVFGEAGAEAVVPLENNLGWLDKLSEMLVERMGGGSTPIVLQVDGKVFAQTAINTINQNTRQTGKLALNVW